MVKDVMVNRDKGDLTQSDIAKETKNFVIPFSWCSQEQGLAKEALEASNFYFPTHTEANGKAVMAVVGAAGDLIDELIRRKGVRMVGGQGSEDQFIVAIVGVQSRIQQMLGIGAEDRGGWHAERRQMKTEGGKVAGWRKKGQKLERKNQSKMGPRTQQNGGHKRRSCVGSTGKG
jgi:hypothetical protein